MTRMQNMESLPPLQPPRRTQHRAALQPLPEPQFEPQPEPPLRIVTDASSGANVPVAPSPRQPENGPQSPIFAAFGSSYGAAYEAALAMQDGKAKVEAVTVFQPAAQREEEPLSSRNVYRADSPAFGTKHGRAGMTTFPKILRGVLIALGVCAVALAAVYFIR